MTISEQLNRLSKLALVASDQAYLYIDGRLAVHKGDALAELRDTPAYDFRVPFSIESGFTVDALAEQPTTGFKFVALRNDTTKEVVVAMAGTDGGDLQDWGVNMKLGWEQWDKDGSGRSLVFEYIDELFAQGFDGKITFTGQSLGGALAQFAAFDFMQLRKDDPAFTAAKLGLITFNGLGAVDALKEYGGVSDAQLAAFQGLGLSAHYHVTNDLISRLGGGHIGGPEYLLDFVSERINPETARPYLLTPIEAHRIETGFYRPFALHGTDTSAADFRLATLASVASIETRNIQPLAGKFVALFNNRATAASTAGYRLWGSLIVALKDSSPNDVAAILNPTLKALLSSNVITADVYHTMSREGIAFLRAAMNSSAHNAGSYLLTALAMERAGSGSGPSQDDINATRQLLGPAYISNDLGAAFYGSGNAARMKRNAAILNGLAVIYPENAGDRELLNRLGANPDDVSRIILTTSANDDGLGAYLLKLAIVGRTADAATIGAETLKFFAHIKLENGKKAIAKFSAETVATGAAFYDQVRRQTAELATSAAKSIGSAFKDVLQQSSDVLIDIGRRLDFRELKQFRDGLFDVERSERDADAKEILRSARAQLELSGQVPVLRVFAEKPVNPFGTATFDPDSEGALSSDVGEDSAGTYVVFLPYSAGPEGQRIRIDLAGTANGLAVLSNGIPLPLSDGAFYLNVPVGRKEVSFALIADDVDTDAAITLSATLVDAAGTPTHETHLEAILVLTNDEDDYESTFNASTSTDFASVDEITGRFDQNDPTVSRTELFGTTKGDLVVADHAAEFIESGSGNDFVIGIAGSGTGTYTAGDDIDAGAGNDVVTGFLGGEIRLGDGDDFLNANDLVRIDASRLTTSGAVHLDELPPEIYSDIGQFIRVRPSGDAPIFNELLGSLDFVYMLDFGDNNLGQPARGVSGKLGVAGSRIERTATGGASFSFVAFEGLGNITYAGGGAELKYGLALEHAGLLNNTQAVVVDGGAGSDMLGGAGGEDFIRGGTGDDRIAGFGADDTLLGEEGSDRILGGAGDDYVDAGPGDDRAWGEDANDELLGGSGSDELFGGDGADYLDGGADEDFLIADPGDDEVFGAAGDDYLEGGEGADYLDGEAGKDILAGGIGNDRLFGGENEDQLAAGDGDDYADGEQGDDVLVGEGGNDTLFGGEGNDVVVGDAGNDILDGEAGADQLAGGEGVDMLFGGDGDDLLWGQAGADDLDGGDGSDQLDGGEGADSLIGGADTDVLLGGAGDDAYVFEAGDGIDLVDDAIGVNRLRFSDVLAEDVVATHTDPARGPQYLVVSYGVSGAVYLRRDSDIRSVEFADGTSTDLADLLARDADLPYSQAPALSIGTSGIDVVIPLNRDMLAFGLAGDDYMNGGSGNDRLYGGDGNDLFSAGGGNDTLVGGAGNDVLNAGGGANTYVFTRGDGQDAIWNGFSGGDDTLQLKGVSRADVSLSHAPNGDLKIAVKGTSDTVTVSGFYATFGSHLEHIVYGDGSQEDMVQLRELPRTPVSVDANGRATGTADDDTLIGDGGDDILDGAAGNDLLMGGAGTDTYVSQLGMGQDTIIELAGDLNVVRLALGIDFDQLGASREGDDLVLAILGSGDAVTLRDYYAASQEWTVLADDGRQKSLAELLQELGDGGGDLVKAAQERWLAGSKNNIYRALGRSLGGGFTPVGWDLYKQEGNGSTSYLTVSVRNSASNNGWISNRYTPNVQTDGLDIPASETRVEVQPLRGALSSAGPGNPVMDRGQLDPEGSARIVGMFNFDGSFVGDLTDLYASNAPVGSVGTSSATSMTRQVVHANAIYGQNIEFITAGRADSLIVPWGITAVDAGGGDDVINATGWLFSEWGNEYGGDFLYGGSGSDRLFGTDDGDVLIAGPGADYLAGMSGDDTYYVVAEQAGRKIIDEAVLRHYIPRYSLSTRGSAGYFSTDTVEFSAGIVADDLRFSWGQFDSTAVDESRAGTRYATLDMSWAPDSAVRIVIPDESNSSVVQARAQYPGESYGIERFRFADGTVVSMDEMLARATAQIGAPDPTRYPYEAGDGSQVIADLEGLAEVNFGPGIDPSSLLVAGRSDDDVFLRIGASDSLRIKDWFATQSVDVRFDDDTVWDAGVLSALPSLIVGTNDYDTLYAMDGSDSILLGLRGDDTFFGASGNDTYVFSRGDGTDYVIDHAFGADPQINTISFTSDITPAQVGVTSDPWGTLYLIVDEGGARVALSGWFDQDGSGKDFRVRFADGTEWDSGAIEGKVMRLPGTPFSDVLLGTNDDDVMAALDGDDLVFAMAGDDVLDGGPGADYLESAEGVDILRGGADDDFLYDADGHNLVDGGEGDDWAQTDSGKNFWVGGPGADNLEMNGGSDNVFAFNRGDGEDRIPVWFQNNQPLTLSLGGGISLAELSFVQEGADIVVDAGDGDRVHLSFWSFNGSHAETRLQLIRDGQIDVYDLAAAVEYWESTGDAASVALQAEHRSMFTDQAFGGGIAYEYATAGGLAAMSAPVLRSFLSSDDFGLVPQPIAFERDQGPELVAPIADQSANEDARFEFTVPAGTFSAPEAVTYEASLANGDDLPAWLHFDAATLTFSGTPLQGDVGIVDVRLTATVAGSSVDDTFAVAVANVNDAPRTTGALGERAATQDQPFTFVVPDGIFTDEDPGDTLSLTAAGLPAWLGFDPVARSFSGTPGNADVGTATIYVTAADSAGATAVSVLDIGVANVNDAPTPADDLAAASEDGVLHIAGNVLSNDGDIDPDTHLQVRSPGTFEGDYGSLVLGADGTFSYALNNASLTVQSLRADQVVFDDFAYAAWDGLASTLAMLRVSIAGSNDSPITASDAAVLVEDARLRAFGNVLTNDTDPDAGSTLSVVNPGSYEDAGTPLGRLALHTDGSYEYMLDNTVAQELGADEIVHERFAYVASDGSDQSMGTLDVAVHGANDAPAVAELISELFATEDESFSFSLSADAFIDADRYDELTYGATRSNGTPLPEWLSFDAVTRTFHGTPGNADVGPTSLNVFATDKAGASASQSLVLSVANVNDAPTVVNDIADQLVEAGTALSFAVPRSTFGDIDVGDELALSSSGIGGGALPSWLTFDPATGAFGGTATNGNIGVYGIEVRATDRSGVSAAADFALAVTAKAGSAVKGGAGADVIYGAGGSETLTGGGGGDALFGLDGNDVLRGGTGNDVMQGGEGSDVLHGGKGNNVLDGGDGSDTIFDGAGSAFIAGGAGADTIRVGGGRDVIAYNRGDGSDTIIGGGDGGNTLSLGGGIRYSDLSFSKSGRDLIVVTGGDDRITLKDWYGAGGNRSLLTLQMIADASEDFDASSSDPLRNRRVETFDFLGLVQAFDQARAQSPGLTSWAVTNALLQFHLAGSDDTALGGDLAYYYGRRGSLAGLSLQAAQQVIGAPGFGADAQQLRPFSGLQDGLVKLG